MKGTHRKATCADYARIVRLLTDGDRGVLVRSLVRCDQDPYPLLDISRGPFILTEHDIRGFSMDGKPHALRITDTELCNVELRRSSNDWFAPEMGGVILLIPQ